MVKMMMRSPLQRMVRAATCAVVLCLAPAQHASADVIWTLAGSGPPSRATSTPSGDGGPATEARIYEPQDVFADGEGNVFIADSSHGLVRRVDSTGTIETVAGGGESTEDGVPATDTLLRMPVGVYVTEAGEVYISERFGHQVRKVDTAGVISTVAGTGISGFSGDGGPAVDAQLDSPGGIWIHEGSLYIADRYNNRVRVVDADGSIRTAAGRSLPGGGNYFLDDGLPATEGSLLEPVDVCVDAEGFLYIVDAHVSCIWKVGPDGTRKQFAGRPLLGDLLTTFSGDNGPAAEALLGEPRGIAAREGEVWIADTANGRIRKVGTDGTIVTVAGKGERFSDGESDPLKAVLSPVNVAVCPNGDVLVCGFSTYRIRAITFGIDPGDYDRDGRVDVDDVLLFIDRYPARQGRFDMDLDGRVGFGDFLWLVQRYAAGR